ncbi:MAG TPA: hypothetical protein VFX92_14280, partial [Candidatus Krumholzibacteria bacterium]|nr:hypothetical protein [Candidatus Krumholzibacteria bacterium]
MKTRFLLLPPLFALAPVITLFANNLGQARPTEMLLPIGASLAFTLVLWPLLALLLRGFARAAVALALFLLLFFSYGHVARLVGGVSLGGMSLANPKLLLP